MSTLEQIGRAHRAETWAAIRRSGQRGVGIRYSGSKAARRARGRAGRVHDRLSRLGRRFPEVVLGGRVDAMITDDTVRFL